MEAFPLREESVRPEKFDAKNKDQVRKKMVKGRGKRRSDSERKCVSLRLTFSSRFGKSLHIPTVTSSTATPKIKARSALKLIHQVIQFVSKEWQRANRTKNGILYSGFDVSQTKLLITLLFCILYKQPNVLWTYFDLPFVTVWERINVLKIAFNCSSSTSPCPTTG